MTLITDRVRGALEPLISAEIVTDIRFAGVACADGRLKPLLSLDVAGTHPERHVAEISRLIQLSGLDVEWSMRPAQPENELPEQQAANGSVSVFEAA